jgi:hypothetical protein
MMVLGALGEHRAGVYHEEGAWDEDAIEGYNIDQELEGEEEEEEQVSSGKRRHADIQNHARTPLRNSQLAGPSMHYHCWRFPPSAAQLLTCVATASLHGRVRGITNSE